jgi:hypothetical protein
MIVMCTPNAAGDASLMPEVGFAAVPYQRVIGGDDLKSHLGLTCSEAAGNFRHLRRGTRGAAFTLSGVECGTITTDTPIGVQMCALPNVTWVLTRDRDHRQAIASGTRADRIERWRLRSDARRRAQIDAAQASGRGTTMETR